uniref:Uncharacterized protein n=1 Tax=Arundo donax TaxID=35708 RepID=A0A0A8Z6G1_ARUDO
MGRSYTRDGGELGGRGAL